MVRISGRFICGHGCVLVGSADAGVRDDGGKKQCMCAAAFRANDPADTERKDSIGQKDSPHVISMDRQTG